MKSCNFAPMLKKLTLYVFFILSSSLIFSCGDYRKVAKSNNVELKFTKAKEYYNKKQYVKAQPLLDELIIATRGTDRAAEVYYYVAYTEYSLKNYTLASYHFKNYATSFSTNKEVEEMEFMYAQCLYLESPNPALDQVNTKRAIEAFQLFINKYPNSIHLAQVNETIITLRKKLETKSYNNGMLFYKMEDYRAAAASLKATLKDFPDINNREEIEFLVIRSSYMLSQNSIQEKQLERLNETLELIEIFKDNYRVSAYSNKVEEVLKNTKKAKDEFLANELKRIEDRKLSSN